MNSKSVQSERATYGRLVSCLKFMDPMAITHVGSAEERLSPRRLGEIWAPAVKNASDETQWNLYLHVPFCKSLCTFCCYKRLLVAGQKTLENYVDFMRAEAEFFAPIFRGVKFWSIYIGGGTPSVLSAGQLERLLDGIHKSFSFDSRAKKTFEFDPMSMTEDRYKAISAFRFDGFSFGIQSLNPDVNEAHNRGRQDRGHVARQFEWIGRAGGTVNVDFLLGLAGTTPEGMIKEIEEVLTRHQPTKISVYFVEPTRAYIAQHYGGDLSLFQAHLKPFDERIPDALKLLADKTGYRVIASGKQIITLKLKALSKDPRTRQEELSEFVDAKSFNYSDISSQVHRPLHLLGLGDSARSQIFGAMRYCAAHDWEDRDPESSRYVGSRFTLEDEMFAYMTLTLRDGDALDRSRFKRTFGRDVVEVYPEALQKLESLGAAQVLADRVVFRPEERLDRFRDTFFFIPPHRLKALVKSLSQKAASR